MSDWPPFLTRAVVSGLLLGVCCGVLGCFVILRGLSFLGEALSHAVLPGLVLAQLAGLPVALGALAAALLAGASVGRVSRAGPIGEDTSVGIVFTGFFALGIVLLSKFRSSSRDLSHLLLGNILGVSNADVWQSLAVFLLVLGALGLNYREFLLTTFDPIQARLAGICPRTYHNGLLTLMALTVVSGLQAVGVVLVTSLLVTPAATARLLTQRFGSMLLLSVLIACLSVLGGLALSFWLNTASGATIVLTATLFFGGACWWRKGIFQGELSNGSL